MVGGIPVAPGPGRRAVFHREGRSSGQPSAVAEELSLAWSSEDHGATSLYDKQREDDGESVSKVIEALAASRAASRSTIDKWSSSLKQEVDDRASDLQRENDAIWRQLAFAVNSAGFGNNAGTGELGDWESFKFPMPPVTTPMTSVPKDSSDQALLREETEEAVDDDREREEQEANDLSGAPRSANVRAPAPVFASMPQGVRKSVAMMEHPGPRSLRCGLTQLAEITESPPSTSRGQRAHSKRASSASGGDVEPTLNGADGAVETDSNLSSCTPITDVPCMTASEASKEIHKTHNAKIRQTMVQIRRQNSERSSWDGRETANDFLRSHMVFADPIEMKDRVRQALSRPEYCQADLYTETGFFSDIARSTLFENISLLVICFNAFWIAYDTDYNDQVLLSNASPIFQVAEHGFCIYFVTEWTIRLLAFRNKYEGLRDRWFVFDTVLVGMMVFETWLLHTIFMMLMQAMGWNLVTGGRDASLLKIFRMVRLTRMARMVRILRSMPELMILLKGLYVASRSVFFTLLLLFVIIYIFAIAFRQLTADLAIGQRYFSSVPTSISSLLLRGTLPDLADLVYDIGDQHIGFAVFLFCFILLASLTVMNMLVGVLVEVVKVVSTVEKEELTVTFVRSKLLDIIQEEHLDVDNNGMLSREEFLGVLTNVDCARFIQECGVDVVGLVEFTELIFKDQPEILLLDFVELVLQLRGSNTATVKDIVDARKFMMQEMRDVLVELKASLNLESSHTRKVFEGRGATMVGQVVPRASVMLPGATSLSSFPGRHDVHVMAPSSRPVSHPPAPGGPAPAGAVLPRRRTVLAVRQPPTDSPDWTMMPPPMEGLNINRRPLHGSPQHKSSPRSRGVANYFWDGDDV